MSKNGKSVEYDYDRVPTREKLKDGESEKCIDTEPAAFGFGVRHAQVAIMFASICVCFIARGHLGVTIVAMTNPPDFVEIEKNLDTLNPIVNKTVAEIVNITDNGNLNLTVEWQNLSDVTKRIVKSDSMWNVYRTYQWNKSVQEMVLGAFFLGYAIMMFPIGLICQRFGGKIPMQVALLLNGIISLVMPWLVLWGGWKAVCACRVLQGMSQAGCFPCIHSLLAKWAPLSERARLASYSFSGATFGTVIAFQVSGLLSGSSWGWPSVFWLSGLLCFVVFGILTVFGAAKPGDHKTISADERNYILGMIDDGVKKVYKTPWKIVLTSKHTWASFAAHVGSAVSFVFIFTSVPSYLYNILHVNLKNNGLLSSLPYCASLFSAVGVGILSDFCTNHKILSLNNARRTFNVVALLGPSICLTLVTYTTDITWTVICLICLLTSHSSMVCSWMINYIDLAPNFSGSLMAAGNTIANIVSLSLPILASLIVTDVTNQSQWRVMFFLVAGLCVITNAIFMVFVTTKQQPWNDLGCSTDSNECNKKGISNEEVNLSSVQKE